MLSYLAAFVLGVIALFLFLVISAYVSLVNSEKKWEGYKTIRKEPPK